MIPSGGLANNRGGPPGDHPMRTLLVAAVFVVSLLPVPESGVPSVWVAASGHPVEAAELLDTRPPARVDRPSKHARVEHKTAIKPAPPPVSSVTARGGDWGKWTPILMCESGGNWGSTVGLYEGGLQFHPGTWDAYKPAGYPEAAYEATPQQQIAVAEKVLASQGWRAWPTCARKAGYR